MNFLGYEASSGSNSSSYKGWCCLAIKESTELRFDTGVAAAVFLCFFSPDFSSSNASNSTGSY